MALVVQPGQPTEPHFAWPFGRGPNGQVSTVQQGTAADIMAVANTIAYCPRGYREDRPEFGWPWPDMNLMPIDASPLLSAIRAFEPRAHDVTLADAEIIASGVFQIDVNVGVPSE